MSVSGCRGYAIADYAGLGREVHAIRRFKSICEIALTSCEYEKSGGSYEETCSMVFYNFYDFGQFC